MIVQSKLDGSIDTDDDQEEHDLEVIERSSESSLDSTSVSSRLFASTLNGTCCELSREKQLAPSAR